MSRWNRASQRSTQSTPSTQSVVVILFVIIAAIASGCEPSTPDDLPSLIVVMNDNNETLAVAALNKIDQKYGEAGLLKALREGGESAQVMASHRLANYPDAKVEQALLEQLEKRGDISIRGSALMALEVVGTSRSLSVIRRLETDSDKEIAEMAMRTEHEIQSRAHP